MAETAADFNNLGIKAYDAKQFVDAIVNFERAYEGAPDSEVVRGNLCNAHQAAANELVAKANDFAAAAKHLEQAIGIDPKNPSPLVQLGAYYLRLDMIPDAIFRLEEAVELSPTNLDAHELLGQAYYEDNDLPSARAQWDYVLEMDQGRESLRKQYEKAFREESVEQDFHRSDSRHFRMSYPKGMTRQVQARILTFLERAYMNIGRKFGGVYPPGQVQVIAYSAEQFTEATQLESHVGALYDGKIRVPLTDGSGEDLAPDEMERRLMHEYTHVVVRFIAGEHVPWWLNEGLAETFSNELSEKDTTVLQRAYAEELDFSLSEIESSQLGVLSPEALGLAYAQAHATTNLLWTRFGQHRLGQLLSDLAVGTTAEEALRRNYKRTYLALEQEVADSFR
ncbi:MAG: hypothetical protein HYV26_06265 [Candidatus Hydrogenedentes bacterium]|nr:hypothetical protein [Candidatus Hydrogenedentota bacterium]MBI3119560.1 hypothetical protein [Candidatus Hydrogenedentota bacterium]